MLVSFGSHWNQESGLSGAILGNIYVHVSYFSMQTRNIVLFQVKSINQLQLGFATALIPSLHMILPALTHPTIRELLYCFAGSPSVIRSSHDMSYLSPFPALNRY